VIPVTGGRKRKMDWWSNDAPESKRVCPFREKNCCDTTFDSYRQMLAHCRQEHPEKPPLGDDLSTDLIMTDDQGRVLSWEEVGRMLEQLSFSYEKLALRPQPP
jgi:hypothetical protein